VESVLERLMPKAKNSVENIPESSWNYRVLEFVTADGKADGRFLPCSSDTGLSDVEVQHEHCRKLAGLVRGRKTEPGLR
jgi:hypothetical protein